MHFKHKLCKSAMHLNALYLLRIEIRHFFIFSGSEIQLPMDKCYIPESLLVRRQNVPSRTSRALEFSIIATNEKKTEQTELTSNWLFPQNR